MRAMSVRSPGGLDTLISAERGEPVCREECDDTPEYCQRKKDHDGPHVCYMSNGAAWFLWGDPR